MKLSFYKLIFRFSLLSALCVIVFSPLLSAHEASLVSARVDQVCSQLQNGESPEKIFSISLANLPDNEVHAKWLDPREWVPDANQREIARYVGSLAFARLNAPFFRVYRAAVSFPDEPKFIPGISSTKVLERTKQGNDKEIVLLERERGIPLALRAILTKDSHYRILDTIASKKDSWLLVRVKLDPSQHQRKGLMKVIEAFEFYKKLQDDRVLMVTGGFALPNTGVLPAKNGDSEPKKLLKPLSTVTMGVLDKVVSTLDVRSQIYKLVSQAVLEGTYENVAALTQITTDPRWKDKWAYQLTPEDSKQIFDENKAVLEKAKKNRWIVYQS